MSQCDYCEFYVYDDEYESYICDVDMDEDEYGRLVSENNASCPYFRDNNDYKIVKHQN